MITPKIFISYSRDDAEFAGRLLTTLRQSDLDIWIDQEQINPGDSFLAEMNRGLTDAAYVLLIVSESSMRSQWVEREWLSTLASKDKVLIPLRIDNSPMPQLLRDIIYVDFRQDFAKAASKLITFLQKETEPPLPATRARPGVVARPLADASRKELRIISRRCLTDTSFNSMLWDLEIDPTDVEAPTLQDRLLKLLHKLDAEGTMEDFLKWLEEEHGACVVHQLQKLREGNS